MGLTTILLAGLIRQLWPRDDGTLAQIQQRGTLRVGLDASFPPFENIAADGQIVGLDVDIAQAIATDLGVEPELVNIGFDGLYDALLARRVIWLFPACPTIPAGPRTWPTPTPISMPARCWSHHPAAPLKTLKI